MNIHDSISDCIGKTPLVRMRSFLPDVTASLFAKLEFFNPTASIKDRTAYGMIRAAEERGELTPGDTIVEPTSGNTGVSLAMIAAARGYNLIITMPESMSIERRRLMAYLGAEVVLTDAVRGMKGAIEKAEELCAAESRFYMPQQFRNTDNPHIHYTTTAQEIWDDTDGAVDVVVMGVGTGGTITGTAERLKELKPSLRVVAVEPASSAVLSGETPGKHGIQGIGAGFVPAILKADLIDSIVKVTDAQALTAARKCASTEGVIAGISSGAALFGASQIAKKSENRGKNIVVVLPDTGERYLSTDLFER
ncbi:cysteine synthase A [Chitinivibrio alkaliphilus]|uniref:Cysteine synthase n=1 Tax=Chitinivibrio alkaliphilus ACht1 TaxID=1313304 RepID=U7D559_9BACT|nr:cysteine synthase A [Chitinivibrio alkaliphilus]ERP31078.1 cysteine synthase A [Chitinivibrio alkaliphilus ACht1]